MFDDHIMYIGPIQIFLYIMWVACRIFYTFATHMTCAHIGLGLQIYELRRPRSTPIFFIVFDWAHGRLLELG